jgi:sulfopyruvate decarboxylase subunit beta
MAKAAGVEHVKTVHSAKELAEALIGQGIVLVRVEPGNADVPIIDLSPKEIIEQFMRCFRSADSS